MLVVDSPLILYCIKRTEATTGGDDNDDDDDDDDDDGVLKNFENFTRKHLKACNLIKRYLSTGSFL